MGPSTDFSQSSQSHEGKDSVKNIDDGGDRVIQRRWAGDRVKRPKEAALSQLEHSQLVPRLHC